MRAAGSDAVVSVRDLRVSFGAHREIRAVDGVTLELGRGESLGLVGESGSGKSVLSRTIMGLTTSREAHISGQVSLLGQDLLAMPERHRRHHWGRSVAMVFQDPLSALHPIMPIGRQVEEAVRRDPSARMTDTRKRAVDLLERVGIPEPALNARRRAHEFSGGMRQRVAIAMAIAARPAVLIADEPTSALDVTVQARILRLFDELRREYEIALILVSHDLGVVLTHTERVAVMYAGQVVEEGPAATVLRQPQMQYTRALMRAIPSLDTPYQSLPKPIPGEPANSAVDAGGCRFAPRCGFASKTCFEVQPELTGSVQRFSCWHPGDQRVQVGTG